MLLVISYAADIGRQIYNQILALYRFAQLAANRNQIVCPWSADIFRSWAPAFSSS